MVDRLRLPDLLLGYVECALWSSSAGIEWDEEKQDFVEASEDDTSFESHNFDVDDIDDASLEAMAKDCADFEEANGRLLEIASRQSGRTLRDHGHDFWLTRNGHGAGFWDRGYRLGLGDALTEAAQAYGSSDLYYGDDGKVHES